MEVVSYKCPSCGAGLSFDGKTQKMVCTSCKNKYKVDELKDLDDFKESKEKNFSWMTYDFESGNGNWSENESDKLQIDTCPSCGAEIMSDKTTASVQCPYCGNSNIIKKRLSGVYRPDYVIPFEIDKEEAKAKFDKFCEKKFLLPKAFKQKHSIENITGMYVPFWLFDCDARAKIKYDAKKVRTWSDSRYSYTQTDHYLLLREGDILFKDIPSDASSKVDAKFMEAIEPFSYSKIVDFKTAYLSGFLADKYDINCKEAQPRAEKRMRNSTLCEFSQTTSCYDSVVPININIEIQNNNIKYALLPVWIFHTKYNNKVYRFAVNGQTGKFVGEFPISKGKYAAWLLSLTATISAIVSLILFIAGGLT